jgi:hypothetical protein
MESHKMFFRTKTFYRWSIALLITLYYSCTVQQPVFAQGENVSFQLFYDQLSPYGEWVDYPNLGYVWIPDAGPDFEPYSTAGHWVMTEYGWTWISDYPWGWAPFHYGRWDFNDDLGWFWIPDNVWGPAWVTWRRADGYYGWAPLRPGISVSLSFNSGYRDIDRWSFVRDRDFGRPDINRYYINRRDYDPIIKNSVVINNTYTDNRRHTTYIAGPPRSDVQKVTGRRISSLAVRDNNRPGVTVNNNQLQIYRPQIQKSNNLANRPAPSRVANLRDVKPMKERNASPQRNVTAPSQINRNEQKQVQPQQQIERPKQEQKPQQAQPQQQFERPKQEQQPRQAQPQQQMERPKQEQQLRQAQPQQQAVKPNQAQPQQRLGQQKREQRKAERVQRKTEQQQKKAAAPDQERK